MKSGASDSLVKKKENSAPHIFQLLAALSNKETSGLHFVLLLEV